MATLRLCVSSFAALFLTASYAFADLKFAVSTEPYAPFAVKDSSGTWKGWEIDLMNAVCKNLNEKCEIAEVSWDGLIPALAARQIDVIWASMTITDERKKTVDFTLPYYITPVMMIGTKTGDMDITPEHLAGKAIGMQSSTIYQDYAEKYFSPRTTIKTYQTQDEAHQDLFAGRLDYAIGDSAAVMNFLAGESGKSCCESKGLVPEDPAVLGYGSGGALRKEDAKLRERIDAAIMELVKDGTLTKITANYPELVGKIVLPSP